MGIELLLPDINRSQKNFTPFGDKIILGLSAIRLGDTIANIIQAREEAGGRFTSLIDFCDRVDLKVVRRYEIEVLILSGAFDNLNPNRKQLINELNFIKLVNKQDSLKKIKLTKGAIFVRDFSKKEKLQFEREFLIFSTSTSSL